MKFIFAIFVLFALAGCGGGGGNPPSTEMQIPPNDGDPNDGDNPPEPFSPLYYLEEIGARYAHAEPRNYRGQGVTIHISENLRHTHVAISANIISLAAEMNAFEEGGRKFHGTGVAGILVTIAPSIRLINHRPVSLVASFSVQIANRSLGFPIPDDLGNTDNLTRITTHPKMIEGAKGFADATGDDMIWVHGLGNALENPGLVPEFTGAFPYIVDGLEDNWLMAAAILPDLRIKGVSCGYTMMWCISAFGISLQTADGTNNDTDYTDYFCCTSGATPQVAGALAVLKSAADDLHSGTEMTLMTNVRLILLETATDLGDPGVDEVYGWGLVNISAGITHLQEIAGQMQAIKNSQIPRLGGAAAAANGGKFAAAAGESAFRFWGGLENSEKWAGLATAEYGGISAFGEVGNSALEINSFLANGEVQNAESESWTAGIQRGNIWRHNDNLQISARQESRLNDGELVLQYSFGKQIRIPIKQKPATIWTAAYSQESDNGKWTAAMEWNALTDAKGFSFAAEIDL